MVMSMAMIVVCTPPVLNILVSYGCAMEVSRALAGIKLKGCRRTSDYLESMMKRVRSPLGNVVWRIPKKFMIINTFTNLSIF